MGALSSPRTDIFLPSVVSYFENDVNRTWQWLADALTRTKGALNILCDGTRYVVADCPLTDPNLWLQKH
jgi:hypothetical protein